MENRFTKRFCRNIVVKILPEFIKRPLRRVFCRFRDSRIKLDLVFSNDESGLISILNDEIILRITEEAKGYLLNQLVYDGGCAEEMFGFISSAKSSHILFDIGAEKGFFSLIFCACNERNLSIAYEPSPSVQSLAKSLIEMNGFGDRIRFEERAIGKRHENVVFYLDKGSGFFNISPSGKFAKFAQPLNLDITTIDAECVRLGIYPDILKIDVEGYEFEVLEGASMLLATKKPKIFLELHLTCLEHRGIGPKAVCDYLKKYNYKFFNFMGRQLTSRDIYNSVKSIYRFVSI